MLVISKNVCESFILLWKEINIPISETYSRPTVCVSKTNELWCRNKGRSHHSYVNLHCPTLQKYLKTKHRYIKKNKDTCWTGLEICSGAGKTTETGTMWQISDVSLCEIRPGFLKNCYWFTFAALNRYYTWVKYSEKFSLSHSLSLFLIIVVQCSFGPQWLSSCGQKSPLMVWLR